MTWTLTVRSHIATATGREPRRSAADSQRGARPADRGTHRLEAGWILIGPLLLAGSGLGLLVSQLNDYTLAPIEEERVSQAAGVNSAAGSFGLAVAGGIMLAALSWSFSGMTEASTVIPPAQQEQIAQTLENDAQVMSNTQLDALLAEQPEAVQADILRINTHTQETSHSKRRCSSPSSPL